MYGKLSLVGLRCMCACVLGAVALAGCGSHARSAAPAASTVTAAFKGSPPALAALHAQANRLLDGGEPAFRSLLARLRGFPVVVNKWASWCGPCKSEFPAFQQASVTFGRRVAFVGLNGRGDTRSEAAAFLHSFPVTYPSYVDRNESIARTLNAAQYYPLTVYLDRSGKPVYEHAGAYVSAGALEQDIRRYLLR